MVEGFFAPVVFALILVGIAMYALYRRSRRRRQDLTPGFDEEAAAQRARGEISRKEYDERQRRAG
jgi:uncharacterized membrane protein